MTTYDQMYRAAVKQAHERSEREQETMVIYRSVRDLGRPPTGRHMRIVWYVRSVAEGEPENATLIEVISCSTSPTA